LSRFAVTTITITPQQKKMIVRDIAGLGIPPHDYVSFAYTGSNPTTITYKSGGSGGATVAVLTLTYDGSNNVTSITKV